MGKMGLEGRFKCCYYSRREGVGKLFQRIDAWWKKAH